MTVYSCQIIRADQTAIRLTWDPVRVEARTMIDQLEQMSTADLQALANAPRAKEMLR